jgi:parallel beta-helix repeat protein
MILVSLETGFRLLTRFCVLWVLLARLSAGAGDLYVAPDGTPSGPGTVVQPYALKTALSGSVGQAGDTFWLRGGIYSLGHVDTRIHGEAGKPITFRQMPGEKARVDGSFTVWNSIGYVIFRDFELFNSDPKRVSSQLAMGFNPTDIEIIAGIQSYSPNCIFINLVIHDQTRHGIYLSQRSSGNLIYGCLIYNNGWRSPDNAEGHSLYIQGSSGTREISDNLLFNSAGVGMHVYDNGGQPLVGVTMDGNVAFNAGSLQNVRGYQDWVIGADSPSRYADQIVFKNNMGYRRPGSPAYSQVEMGREGVNGTVTMSENYMPLGLLMNNWTLATVTGNTFAPRNSAYAVDLRQSSAVLSAAWDNSIYSSPAGKGFRHNSTACTFSEWRSATGYDSSSTDMAGSLTGSKVFVRPNLYENGRANIIVYNWDNLSTVPVDVSWVLPVGTAYEVRNAQDFFGAPVLNGTFDGQPLQLPMTGLTVASPLGGMLTPPPTGPTFNVFVLLPLSSPTNSAPTISGIANKVTTPNTATASIPFTVSDAETEGSSLTVSSSSSNPALIPDNNIVFEGSSSNRTITVTPATNQSGMATVTLTASDGSLRRSTSFVVAVIPPPTIALISPANGASYLTPATINLTASVVPHGHTITQVQFYSGATLLGEITAPPYSFLWTNVGEGSYSLSAQAVYNAGSAVTSAPVNMTVTSTLPTSASLTFTATSGTISAPFIAATGAIYQLTFTGVTEGGRAAYSFTVTNAGNYTVSAQVDAPGEAANAFFVNIDAEPTDSTMIWDTPVTSGWADRTVSWRGNGTSENNQFNPKVFTLGTGTHQLIVRGREANCRLGTITLAPYDTNTPPFVTLTMPKNGATVSGSSAIVSANASDNDGVAGVQFKLDGENLGAEDTNAPYGVTLNTTLIADGPHTLAAVVRDAAGNQSNATLVSIVVINSVLIRSIDVTDASVTITWASISGVTYRIAYKSSLMDANWTDLSANITATGASTLWTDEAGSKFAERYYTVYVTD